MSEAEFLGCFDTDALLLPALKDVYTELSTNENQSCTVLADICQALAESKSITEVKTPPNALALVIGQLKAFPLKKKIPLYFTRTLPANEATNFSFEAKGFPDANTQAVTYRTSGHSAVAIVVNSIYETAPQLYFKEIILHELAHCLSASFCKVDHKGRTTARCTPKKLGAGVKGCKAQEVGYLFELQSRGCAMQMEGPQLVLTQPCGLAKKRKISLAAPDVVQLAAHTSVKALTLTLVWSKEPTAKKPKTAGSKKKSHRKGRSSKASRKSAKVAKGNVRSDVKLVPEPAVWL